MVLSGKRLGAVMAVVALTFATGYGHADIQVPTNVSNGFTELETGTTSEAISSNLTLLNSKLGELKAEVTVDKRTLVGMTEANSGYRALVERIGQFEATIAALEKIVAQLSAGFGISNYAITTDAATQVTTVKITMTDDNGTEVTLDEPIPTVTDDTGGGSGEDGADMLTQILQQLAMQYLMGGAGGNPLANVQSTLNNLVQGASPLTGIQCANSDAKAGNGVAVYDIAAAKVYMPDGSVLEAHSGMGAMMDNPAFVNQRMNGPTPPNTYNLSLRENLFHGVQAIRMTPTNPGAMFGRDGMLAHSKLVRGNNGSHGCVAFANYGAFLAAFQRGQVKQLVVVANGGEAQKACKTAPQVDTSNPQSKVMGAGS